MNANEKLIQQFYFCFSQRDHQGMGACYHPDAQFSDEVFQLKGKQIGAMWHMLCESGKDFVMQYHHCSASDEKGTAAWEAFYTFSQTKRKVHNQVSAQFEFREGKIFRHLDVFSFWKWAGMALGPVGYALGWSPLIRKRVQKTAAENLSKFIQKHPQYA
ncbi:MAG: nuclear transport factor 2 family protein [Bacteroidota bacterium]